MNSLLIEIVCRYWYEMRIILHKSLIVISFSPR